MPVFNAPRVSASRVTAPSALIACKLAPRVSPRGSPHAVALRLTLIAAACVAISACSTFDNATGRVAGLISPYKAEVVQGNFVSKEQKDALQIGMARPQVRDILGSPLVTSAFHADRWEYVFTIRRQGQEPQQRKLTVFFKGDELVKVDSDELISEEDFVTSLSVNRKLGKVPLLEVPQEVLREFGLKNALPNAAQNTALAGTNTAQSATNSVAPANYPPLEAPGATTSAWDASTQRAAANTATAAAARVNPPAAPTPPLAALAPLLISPAPAAAPTAPQAATAAATTTTTTTTSAPASSAGSARPEAPAPAVSAIPAAPAATPPASTAPIIAAQAATTASAATPVAAPVAPRTAPAPVVSSTAPSAVVPIVAAPAAAPTPVPPPQPASSASTLASADPEITTFLNRWTSDWQSRNAAAYFSHYLLEFKGTSGTRAEWEALRRTRIEGRSRISVAASDVRVRMVSPTEARLVFRQVYESDAFNEIGTKAMFLVKRDGRWLIEREFFTPAQ